MTDLHFRALAALPAPLAALCRAHAYVDELQELVQEAALALLAAPGDSAQRIYNRARSRVRRYKQNPAYYASNSTTSLDDLAAPEADNDELPALTRKQIRAQIQADLGLNTRDAQRLLKKQLKRMRENGDLFAESGNDGEGEK